jgi:hypothetical protein
MQLAVTGMRENGWSKPKGEQADDLIARGRAPMVNAVKRFCDAFLVMKWWSDCLHSTRVAKKNVREAGTLRLRPGWADATSAGAVRPRNSADDSQRPGGPTHKKGEASQLVSAFQAFDSTQRFFPGPYSPGEGCVDLPGLNRNLTRFDFTVFLLVKTLHSVALRA